MIRIINSSFIKSAVLPRDYPEPDNVELAFAGKSNVGKSSLINTILNRKALVKISSTPGKTRLLNFFRIKFRETISQEDGYFNLVDFPGYGYAKVSKTERDRWQKMLWDYFDHRQNLIGVVLLIDIRHKADPKDLKMIEMLTLYNTKFLVVATKADKIPRNKIKSTLNSLQSQFSLLENKIIPFSSLKKTGIDNVLAWIGSRI